MLRLLGLLLAACALRADAVRRDRAAALQEFDDFESLVSDEAARADLRVGRSNKSREAASARRGRNTPEAAIIKAVMQKQKALKRKIKKALARMEQPDVGDAELEVLEREDDDKVGLTLMTDAEYQQWRWKEGKHRALSMAEAQDALKRHFDESATYTHRASLAALIQMEEGAATEQRREFWRQQRDKLQPLTFAMNASNGTSLLVEGGWDTLKPTVAAFACLQVDIHLMGIGLPFIYVNLGISGQLIYNPHSKCWAWQLDVSIGLSGGLTITQGLRLGIGVSFTGTWKIQEVPFSATGLDASQYRLPTKCGAQRNPNITPEGQTLCHSGAPFRLVWIGLKGLLARAADRIFPVDRARNLLKRVLSWFKKQGPKKTYMQIQTERWEAYKNILKPPPDPAGEPVGTDAFQLRCVAFTGLGDPSAKTPIRGLSTVRCGVEVGKFNPTVYNVNRHTRMLVYEPQVHTLGGQFSFSGEAPLEDGSKAAWTDEHGPIFNALVDRSSNSQIRVVVTGPDVEKNRVEGLVTLTEAAFTGGPTHQLEATVGCDQHKANCAGTVRLQLTRIHRRGKLSLQCLDAEGLRKAGMISMSDPYCVLEVAPSVVLGANYMWRSTYVKADHNPWWGEGAAWGVYDTEEYKDQRFPLAGAAGTAVKVTIISAEDGMVDNLKSGILDLLKRPDDRKVRSADKVLGEVELSWQDLLGEEGFHRGADEAARVIQREITKKGHSHPRGTVRLRVAWAPLGALEEREEADKWQDTLDIPKVAWAASGLYTAGEQFAGKLPKYAEQVLERLVDHPETDRDKSNSDCAVKSKSLFWNTTTRCALLDTDGSSGARMSRKVDEADPKQSLYRVDAHPTDWVQDDRVMNFGKAGRVSERRTSPHFWKELATSAANLFARTVADIQALFNIYFADEADWDGDCDSLKPSFELPFERVDGTEKGEAPGWRYQAETPEKQRESSDPGDFQARGVRIAQPDVKQRDAEEAHATFNPAADYVFAYGHGYVPNDPGKTAMARLRFLTADPPTRGLLGGYHVYGDTSPTMNTHLWCELAKDYVARVKELRSELELTGASAALDELDTITAKRVGSSLVFNEAKSKVSQNFSHPKALVKALDAFDVDRDGELTAEELTISFDAACVDTADCGDRAECERVRLQEAFLAIFPRLTLEIHKHRRQLDALLTEVEAAEDLQATKEKANQVIDVVKMWLYDLGACHSEASKAVEVAEAARGGKKALELREATCTAARAKAAELEALGKISPAEADHTVHEQMAMDFHEAFALRTELPISIQNAALAKKGFQLLGALWEGLPAVREALPQGIGDDRDGREKAMMKNLEENAQQRMARFSSMINPEGAWRLQFPLTNAIFVLTMTWESAKPGYCGANNAMLWFTTAVTGITNSWTKVLPPMTRCFTGKVHPWNFFVSIQQCGVIKADSRSSVRNMFVPSWNSKDRDTTVTLFIKLFHFSLGSGITSIFTSLDPTNKIFSPMFLTASAGAAASIPLGASLAIQGLMLGPLIWFARSITDGGIVDIDDLVDAGVMGLGKALRKIYRALRGKALANPQDPGSSAIADPQNGDEWIDNEDPTKRGGTTFGLTGPDADLTDEDEIIEEDNRLWAPLEECNSLCGGHSRWDSPTGKPEGKYSAVAFKSLSRLRADQCVACRWQDDACDRFAVEEDRGFMKGYLCCKGKLCAAAPYRPGPELPMCAKKKEEEVGAKEGETPSDTEQPERCCNTQCGALGFEGATSERKVFTRFSDANYLKPNECAHCVWEKKACKPGWAMQGEQGHEKLCCLKRTCGTDADGKPIQREPVVRAAKWLPNPGCASDGPDPPYVFSGSDAGRTGGTACGVSGFGKGGRYKFNDPAFLMQDDQPNQCAQCIWVKRSQSCTESHVVLKDRRVEKGLSKVYSQSMGKYHLCCAKLQCIPSGAALLQEKLEAITEVSGGVPFYGRPVMASPGALEEQRRGAQGDEQKDLNLIYVMFLQGTKHTRHYNGSVLGENGKPVVTTRSWWSWNVNVQGWNNINKPETIVDNFLPFDVNPTIALNLMWDITPEITKAFNDALLSQHTRRVDKCKACILNNWTYCNRKYIDPKYTEQEGEKCLPRTKQAALHCTSVVGFDDYGAPTSPRFITNAEECGKMKYRKANAGYKRSYGATQIVIDSRGQEHRPANPPDPWGNSMDVVAEE